MIRTRRLRHTQETLFFFLLVLFFAAASLAWLSRVGIESSGNISNPLQVQRGEEEILALSPQKTEVLPMNR